MRPARTEEFSYKATRFKAGHVQQAGEQAIQPISLPSAPLYSFPTHTLLYMWVPRKGWGHLKATTHCPPLNRSLGETLWCNYGQNGVHKMLLRVHLWTSGCRCPWAPCILRSLSFKLQRKGNKLEFKAARAISARRDNSLVPLAGFLRKGIQLKVCCLQTVCCTFHSQNQKHHLNHHHQAPYKLFLRSDSCFQ